MIKYLKNDFLTNVTNGSDCIVIDILYDVVSVLIYCQT